MPIHTCSQRVPVAVALGDAYSRWSCHTGESPTVFTTHARARTDIDLHPYFAETRRSFHDRSSMRVKKEIP